MPRSRISYVNLTTKALRTAFYASYGSVWTGNKGMHQDVPVEAITINKVTVE